MTHDPRTALRTGTVTAFDGPVGLGELTAPDGTVLAFHCVAIADGTRTIEVGTEVTYRAVARHGGRWEADEVSPRRPSSGP